MDETLSHFAFNGTTYKRKLLILAQAQTMKENWKSKADEAYAKALKAPWPDAATLEEHVY